MSAEQLLGSGDFGAATVVADLEAGIGTLSRLEAEKVDLTVVVVEPTPRSLDVGSRALAIARERQQGRILVVANKVRDVDADVARVREWLGDVEVVVVPEDDAVVEADARGVALLDHDPGSPALASLASIADLLA